MTTPTSQQRVTRTRLIELRAMIAAMDQYELGPQDVDDLFSALTELIEERHHQGERK